ncbi:S-adenosylmethionine decarboxylase [Ancylomarina longa]|uniref:Spermidine synthase n=1 Tax=Ancylomarina longa TaxID=2487017 RepID=A0A434AUP1_9BACT|nr:S-adenosylmethionine decarboxylase [Ancylomarina longa]RUT78063.1 spermidine synthase [Ancylomarina longa]
MTILKSKILDAKIHNLRFWISEFNPEVLESMFQNFLEEADFVILNFSDYHFPVQGYTAFWLLAESHLAIHTFPGKGCSYIELSSCNQAKSECFHKLVKQSKLQVDWNKAAMEISLPED